jgi:hypothetical protein
LSTIDIIDFLPFYLIRSMLLYLDDVAGVLSVVEPALHVVAAFGTMDDDGKGIDAAGDIASEHMRQLIRHVAPAFPCVHELIDDRRKVSLKSNT